MSDIVVTGGTGFLGRALLSELIRRGHEPVAFVRGDAAAAELTERFGKSLRPICVDWASPVSLHTSLAKARPGTVFHLAGGRVAPGVGALRDNVANNVTPTLTLLEALDLGALDAFLLVSTGEVYGPQPGPFHEGLTPRPATPYAAAKLAAEALVMGATGAHGPAIIARLGVVYGPLNEAILANRPASKMLLPQLMASARRGEPFSMSTGTQTRDFLHVDDAARALADLASCPKARGLVVNVGSGRSHPIVEVAQRLLEELGNPIALEVGALTPSPNEIVDYRLATERLANLTGFSPSWTIEDGVREMAATRLNGWPRE